MSAEEIIARRQAETDIVEQHYRDQAVEQRVAEAAYHASLPQLPFVPPGPPYRRGVLYRLCTARIMAFDPVDKRAYLAAVHGDWVPVDRAEILGVGPPDVMLRP